MKMVFVRPLSFGRVDVTGRSPEILGVLSVSKFGGLQFGGLLFGGLQFR